MGREEEDIPWAFLAVGEGVGVGRLERKFSPEPPWGWGIGGCVLVN